MPTKNNLKVRHPDHLDNDEELNFFKKLRPDLVVVVAYGKIIPKRFLNIENIKFINVHASLCLGGGAQHLFKEQ